MNTGEPFVERDCFATEGILWILLTTAKLEGATDFPGREYFVLWKICEGIWSVRLG